MSKGMSEKRKRASISQPVPCPTLALPCRAAPCQALPRRAVPCLAALHLNAAQKLAIQVPSSCFAMRRGQAHNQDQSSHRYRTAWSNSTTQKNQSQYGLGDRKKEACSPVAPACRLFFLNIADNSRRPLVAPSKPPSTCPPQTDHHRLTTTDAPAIG